MQRNQIAKSAFMAVSGAQLAKTHCLDDHFP
jgi:hypothetical protein